MTVQDFVYHHIQLEPLYRGAVASLGRVFHYKASDLVNDVIVTEIRHCGEMDLEAQVWQARFERASRVVAMKWIEAAEAFAER